MDAKVYNNSAEGIYISGDDVDVSSNKSYNNTTSNIHLFAGNDVNIKNNWVRTGANLPTNGIFVRSTGSIVRAFLFGNDCQNGGETNGISASGAQATIGHNRNNDGSHNAELIDGRHLDSVRW